MRIEMNKLLQGTLVITALTLLSLVLLFLIPFPSFSRRGAQLGAIIACANALLSFAALSWTYVQSDKIFFSAFYGGMAWKLTVLSVTVYLLMRADFAGLTATLLSLAAMTLILNVAELFCLPAHLSWTLKKS